MNFDRHKYFIINKETTKNPKTTRIKNELSKKTENYQQIIRHLFTNDGIKTNDEFKEIKEILYGCCHNEKVEFISNLTSKKVTENRLSFVINE